MSLEKKKETNALQIQNRSHLSTVRTGGCLLALVLAAAYFCHRLYGVFIPLEADALPQLYYRVYPHLLREDYNPFQWYYMGYMPFAGHSNPFIFIVSFVVRLLFPGLSQVAQGLTTCLLTSWLLLWLLAWSIFFCLRYCSCSRLGSTLGAVIVSFTGFHLVGVREFNHMFLVSFLFVGPTFICFSEVCRRARKGPWAAASALCIGCSCLGGVNAPMYYYLPLFFILPFVYHGMRCWKNWLTCLGWQVISVAASLGVGAVVLLPGVAYLSDMNRSTTGFTPSGLGLKEKFITLFLRDWWRTSGWNYAETDTFLGLPVLCFFVLGLWSCFMRVRKREKGSQSTIMMAILLMAGLLISLNTLMPAWLWRSIAWFYHQLSISNPDRFFLLALLPAAFFAARGFDDLKGRFPIFVYLSLPLIQAWLFVSVLAPVVPSILPDTYLVGLLSMAVGFAAIVLSMLRYRFFKQSSSFFYGTSIATIIAVFLMYAWAPTQVTMYPWHARHSPLPASFGFRIHWRNILGLSSHYRWSYSIAERIFDGPQDILKAPWTLEGRVLALNDLKLEYAQRAFLYAPRTGHQFALTQLFDPATPRRISEFARTLTPAKLDLAAVCSVLPYRTAPWPPTLLPARRRPSCLPKAFLVPQAQTFDSDEEVLTAMQHLTREDFLKAIYLNCKGKECLGLPRVDQALAQPLPLDSVKIVRDTQLPLQYEVSATRPAFLFVSIPYRSDWEASVDNVRVAAFRADHAFMAIPLKSGKSLVRFALGRTAALIGRWITLISVLGLVSLLAWHLGLRHLQMWQFWRPSKPSVVEAC